MHSGDSWQYCRLQSTFLECYAEEQLEPRSRSLPASWNSADFASTSQQQAYAENLAERAEDQEFLSWQSSSSMASHGQRFACADLVTLDNGYYSSPGWVQDDFDSMEWSEMSNMNSQPQGQLTHISHNGLHVSSRTIATSSSAHNTPETPWLRDYRQAPRSSRGRQKGGAHMEETSVSRQDSANATTLMLCNIPCRVQLDEIVSAVHSLGFEDSYDFLYAPGPKRQEGPQSSTSRNLGYAFVNFVTPQLARQFSTAFDGFSFDGRNSGKAGIAKVARVQGLRNNLMRANIAQCVLPKGMPAPLANASDGQIGWLQ